MLKQVSDEQFNALMAAFEKADRLRAEKMPDEKAAILQLNEAHTRLKELGWKEAIYCPKDGSMFSSIEAGSTGIHQCNYEGEWPQGSWNVYDGDVWPSHPILWRPRKDTDPDIDNGLAMDYRCCKEPE